MSQQHTPGEWESEPTGDGLERMITGWHGDGACTVVAVVSGNRTSQETTEANARLISACPTMYEYIRRRADEGDGDAAKIIESIG